MRMSRIGAHLSDLAHECAQRISKLVRYSCVDERDECLLGLDLVIEHLVTYVNDLEENELLLRLPLDPFHLELDELELSLLLRNE